MILGTGNSFPLVSPPPPSTKGITSTPLPAPEVIDGPNNAVYGNSPPVGQSFTLVIATTFPITLPGLTLTFTGPSGQTFIANPADFFIGQDTLTLPAPLPPNSYIEYTISTPSLFNEAGQWSVTLSNSGASFPSTTYQLGIGGFLPKTAISLEGSALFPYTAQGVSFAGSAQGNGPTYLVNNSLSGVDTGNFSFSFWLQGFTTFANRQCVLFVTNPAAEFPPINGFGYAPFFSTRANSQLQMNLAGSNSMGFNAFFSLPYLQSDNNWHHYLGSFNTNKGVGAKLAALYIDDVLTNIAVSQDVSGQFVNPIAGLPFYFGDDGQGPGYGGPGSFNLGATFNAADVWIASGINLLVSVGGIPTFPIIAWQTRRSFTNISSDGVTLSPRDPVGFPNASVLFSGNASTFPVNRGIGGAFALVGNLGNVLGPGGIPV